MQGSGDGKWSLPDAWRKIDRPTVDLWVLYAGGETGTPRNQGMSFVTPQAFEPALSRLLTGSVNANQKKPMFSVRNS